jgi:hypothetical protein
LAAAAAAAAAVSRLFVQPMLLHALTMPLPLPALQANLERLAAAAAGVIAAAAAALVACVRAV